MSSTNSPPIRQAPDNRNLSDFSHFRYALSIHPPAFCRHCVIFFPYTGGTPPLGRYPGEFDLKSRALDVVAEILSDICQRRGKQQNKDKLVEVLQENRTTTINVGEWKGYQLRMKADIHSEFYTVTYVLDTGPESTFDASEELLKSSDPSLYNYYILWDEFDREHKSDLRILLATPDGMGRQRGALIGDVRGFSIHPPRSISAEQFYSNYKEVFLSFVGLDAAGLPLNLIERENRAEQNVILTHLKNYAAIYGSDLGNPRVARADRPLTPTPVRYFLIHENDNDHQTGLAVNRAHSLIELRIASLIDRHTISDVSAAIRRLGDEITRLLLRASVYSITSNGLRRVLSEYSRLAANCHGGLIYRVSQSARYYNALEKTLRDTETSQIDGRQAYVHFIIRTHDRVMRSTEAVGERYRRMGERVDRLISMYHVDRQKNLTVVGFLVATFILLLAGINVWRSSNITNIQSVIISLGTLLLLACIGILKLRMLSWLVPLKSLPSALQAEILEDRAKRRHSFRGFLSRMFKWTK